jgi:NADPH-dependent curcumin reductase CurA
MTALQIVLAARPKGRPQLTDFRLKETAVPQPASEQLLLETQYLSLDPYMRGRMDDRKSYAKPLQVGDVMTGEAVARVLASNHSDYAEGDIVLAPTGWRRTRSRTALALTAAVCASSIPPLRRLQPVSGCSACQGSLPMAACA